MNFAKSQQILKRVAKQNGVSVSEVRQEIALAIAAAKTNPDPDVQAFWRNVPHKGAYPTPEEVIAYLAKQFY